MSLADDTRVSKVIKELTRVTSYPVDGVDIGGKPRDVSGDDVTDASGDVKFDASVSLTTYCESVTSPAEGDDVIVL